MVATDTRATDTRVPARPTAPVPPATGAICPYLLAADDAWRASTPAREHRCTAVRPPTPIAQEKQRRLCLVADHRVCATYGVATGQGGLGAANADAPRVERPPRASGRAIVRTAPLVLDHGRFSVGVPGLRAERGLGQVGLILLMGVALIAILVARISAPSGGPDGRLTGGAVASPTADATPAPSGSAAVPGRTLVPSDVEPTPGPAAADATPDPSADPASRTGEPSAEPPAEEPAAEEPAARTYKVKRGDTFSGIAAEFETTVKKLQELNDIDDPTLLRVGVVLELP